MFSPFTIPPKSSPSSYPPNFMVFFLFPSLKTNKNKIQTHKKKTFHKPQKWNQTSKRRVRQEENKMQQKYIKNKLSSCCVEHLLLGMGPTLRCG